MLSTARAKASSTTFSSNRLQSKWRAPVKRYSHSKSEEIWQEFRSKHRPTWAEINLDNVAHNVQSLRTKIPNNATLIAVVKADGYGHGADYIGAAALEAGAQRLAVAAIEEGISLRNNGIVPKETDIMVLGLSAPGTEKALLSNRLIPTIATVESLSRFVSAHQELGLNDPLRYHLKIDTGMGRIGAQPEEIDTFVKNVAGEVENGRLARHSVMEGVFTHFSKADETDKTHTRNQVAKFHAAVAALKKAGFSPKFVHSSNSAGVIDSSLIYDKKDIDSGLINAWRVGVSLYGFYPSEEVDKSAIPELLPVMSWKTKIAHIKSLAAGHTISYGGEFVTGAEKATGAKKSKIATLPLGYADGFRRRLGRHKPPHKPTFQVIVNGERASIAGRVCMDMIHIDVTHIPEVQAGDEVVILGSQDGLSITAEQMAKKLKTINYEISCLVGKRVPRLYTKNGQYVALKSIISDTNIHSM